MGYSFDTNNTSVGKQDALLTSTCKSDKVLVVDDQPLSLLHASDLISYEGYKVIKASHSNEALSLAYEEQPDIILMDIVMPELNGLQVAQKLKLQPHTQSIPIVLMSVTDEPHILDVALNIGVEDFLLKPLERNYLYPKLKNLIQQKQLNEELNRTQKMLFSLAMAIENRSVGDGYKSSFQLANLAMGFAQYLKLDQNDIQDLVSAAYLHDIGTINIPEKILAKQGNLTSEEENIICQHPIIGEQLCQPLHNQPNLLAIIRHHHEKYDGSGYPDKLVGEQIPFLAQIFQMVDIYHALTNKRHYKPAYSIETSLSIMEEETLKGWLNPQIFEQFKEFICQTQFSEV